MLLAVYVASVNCLILCFDWASLVAQLVKNPLAMRVDLGLIPGLGRSPGEGKGYLLQYFGVENSMDCIVHGITRVGHDLATKPPPK